MIPDTRRPTETVAPVASPDAPIDYAAIAQKLSSVLDEQQRLGRLSARELVIETLASDVADYLHVVELMNRVFPRWWEIIQEEELK